MGVSVEIKWVESRERHGRSQRKGQVHDVSQERSHRRCGNRDRVRNDSQGKSHGKSRCRGRAKRQALQESELSAQVYTHKSCMISKVHWQNGHWNQAYYVWQLISFTVYWNSLEKTLCYVDTNLGVSMTIVLPNLPKLPQTYNDTAGPKTSRVTIC